MANDASVAPKERVNIVYKSQTGDKAEEVELPLKLLMVGDYSGRESDEVVEDRKTININKDNFDDVLKSFKLGLDIQVPNKLDDKGDELPVSLSIESIKDFTPDNIAKQIPELKALLDLRQELQALKGPLGNIPAFRKTIQSLLSDDSTRQQIETELGISKD